MLIKYYLSNYIKGPFENFSLGLGIAWVGPVTRNRIGLTKFGT